MTYFLKREKILEKLKNRSEVNELINTKMVAFRSGLDPLEEDDMSNESALSKRQDANYVKKEFEKKVNLIFTDATDNHAFLKIFKAEHIPFFNAIFPRLLSMFKGSNVDPRIVNASAVKMIEELVALDSNKENVQPVQPPGNNKGTNPPRRTVPPPKKVKLPNIPYIPANKYVCEVCDDGVQLLKTSRIKHEASAKHLRNFQNNMDEGDMYLDDFEPED